MTAGTKTKKRKPRANVKRRGTTKRRRQGDKVTRRHGDREAKAQDMISESRIQQIKRKVSREFPEFKDVQPVITEKIIRPQSSLYKKLSLGVPKVVRRIFRLKFTKKIETVDHAEIERILMVSLNEQGKIIKITESK